MQQLTSYLALDCEGKHLIDQRDGSEITLSFSEMKVLSHMLTSPGAIFSKEELLAVGWPDRVVALTSLTQCISILRKKLEPFAEIQLKTIARRGYQLNISEQSHVHMLAISDGEAIREAIVSVSFKVKAFGIVLLLMLVGLVWYFSDQHLIMKKVVHWTADTNIPLNIGGNVISAKLFHLDGVRNLNPLMWQKHIISEGYSLDGYEQPSAFASTDGKNYSFSVCPNVDEDGCNGKGVINITAIKPEAARLNIEDFISLSKRMERRIKYNRIILPPTDEQAELIEHNYHADIYFPVENQLLVRTDLNLSLVYDDENTGQFYSSTCTTDEDCITTPIKYQIRGSFKKYKTHISDIPVDVFQVKVKQKELTKPQSVSDSAAYFYREIRKDDIRDDILYYYRIYEDKNTAVWIVPQMGYFVAWTTYNKMKL